MDDIKILTEDQLKYLSYDNLDPDIPPELRDMVIKDAGRSIKESEARDEIYLYFAEKIKEETKTEDIVEAWKKYKELHAIVKEG